MVETLQLLNVTDRSEAQSRFVGGDVPGVYGFTLSASVLSRTQDAHGLANQSFSEACEQTFPSR